MIKRYWQRISQLSNVCSAMCSATFSCVGAWKPVYICKGHLRVSTALFVCCARYVDCVSCLGLPWVAYIVIGVALWCGLSENLKTGGGQKWLIISTRAPVAAILIVVFQSHFIRISAQQFLPTLSETQGNPLSKDDCIGVTLDFQLIYMCYCRY